MDSNTQFGKVCEICLKPMNLHRNSKCSKIKKTKHTFKETPPSKRKALSINSQEHILRQIHKSENKGYEL